MGLVMAEPNENSMSSKYLLFSLASDFLMTGPVSSYSRGVLEECVPQRGNFFILRGKEFYYPDDVSNLNADSIWNMIGCDRAGIFERSLSVSTDTGDIEYHVTVEFIGEDYSGHELAFGLVNFDNVPPDGQFRDKLYSFMAELKRFYEVFSENCAVKKALTSDDVFRYIVDVKSSEIVLRKLPKGKEVSEEDEKISKDICERVIPQFLFHPEKPLKSFPLDKRLENFNISKTILLDTEYIIFTFKVSHKERRQDNEMDKIIRNFSHKIRGKLGALQAAASQLTMKEGEPVNSDDVELVNIIKSATGSIIKLVDRLHQYGRSASDEKAEIDLDQMLGNIVESRKETIPDGVSVRLKTGGGSSTITGDPTRVQMALEELIENALISKGGDVEVSTGSEDDKVRLIIKNRVFGQNIEAERKKDTDFFEPFFSLESERAGMGLTIARRIIKENKGSIKIEDENDTTFNVSVAFPAGKSGGKKVE